MGHSNISTAAAPVGYRHGLRQPGIVVDLRLTLPAIVDLPAIDDWLENAFLTRIETGTDTALPGDTASDAAARAIARRVLCFGAALLRAMKIPAFSMGGVLAIKTVTQEPLACEVRVAIPCTDHVSHPLQLQAYRSAADAVLWMMSTPRTAENTAALYAHLDKACMDPARGQVNAGESTIPMLRAAWSRNVPFRHLGLGTYLLGWGSKSLRTNRGSVQSDSAFGAWIAQDKWRCGSILRQAGLPAPVHLRVGSVPDALAAAQFLGWPVVVKPSDADRGEGVTVSVSSEAMLESAYQRAASFSRNVIVERQVAGVCHRILVVRDKVMLVSKRMPKSVRGDGVRSVRELVEQANQLEQAKPPWVRLKPFLLDAPALQCLAALDLSPDKVPAVDTFIPLREIQSSQWGGVVEDMTAVIHPDNKAIAIKATRLLGLSVAGVDLMSVDITRPWHENGAIINEMNFSSLLPGVARDNVLADLLGEFLAGDGRIPVEVVLGGPGALDTGHRLRREYAQRGIRCYVAAQDVTVSPEGEAVAMVADGLFARCMALMVDTDVQAVVVVIQGDELLRRGLPFDRVDSVTVADDASGGETPGAQWLQATLSLLEPYRVGAPQAAAM